MQQERAEEVKTLAVEAAGVFAACGVVREMRAAMALHREAEEIESERYSLKSMPMMW